MHGVFTEKFQQTKLLECFENQLQQFQLVWLWFKDCRVKKFEKHISNLLKILNLTLLNLTKLDV